MRRIALLGVEFDDIGLDDVLALLLGRPDGAPFAYAVTPNADHLVRLRRLPELLAIYRSAWLCLLDSQFLSLLASTLRLPRPRVVTGADLTGGLLARLDGSLVAVIGLPAAHFNRLRKRYPAITFLHHQPPMGLLYNVAAFAAARDFAVAAQARFTFVALGSPVQEILANAITVQGGRGTGLCIGAALEFCTGSYPRAPGWMRRAGLEWLYRLGRDPGRLGGRYLLDDPPILLALVWAAFRRRFKA